MDNKEAIKNLEFIKDYCSGFDGLTIASLRNLDFNLTRDEIEALDIAIASLEAWDKIKKEIEALEYLNIEDGSDGYDKYIEQYEVLKIIDKYRMESEDKESD